MNEFGVDECSNNNNPNQLLISYLPVICCTNNKECGWNVKPSGKQCIGTSVGESLHGRRGSL